ncbi:MAG: class I SAM-dependent methyltransferase, partial [bacterium]|nr:class I SAM-dependent methyltransferase [bacterium]
MEDPQKSGARIKDLVCDIPFFFDLIRYIILGGTKKLNLEALNAVGKENKKILDIACGTCNLTELITAEDYTGIDIHELFLQKAKSRFPKRKFMKMDGTDLKFRNKSFDKVIIMNFLH